MKDITTLVGSNLKKIRKDRSLTLEKLSALTGVSTSMLGEIERGITNPTITILWKIADGLKISFTELIKDEKPPVSVVYHREAGASIDGDGFKIFPVFTFDPDKRRELCFKTFEAGAGYESPGHRAGMEETILVCDGELSVGVTGEVYHLSAGDAIMFSADVPHSYHNHGDTPASVYMILFYGE